MHAGVVCVVQGKCGAGECGAVLFRARVVQNEVQVVQGECSAGYGAGWGAGRCSAVMWCREMQCGLSLLDGSACEIGSVWYSVLNKPNA